MQKLLGVLLMLSFISGAALAQENNAAKAEQVLSQARAAIGDASKQKALSSLSAAVTSARIINGNPAESEIEYDILLPDKFRRRESRQPFATVTVIDDDSTATYRVPMDNATGAQDRESLNDPQAQARRKDDFARVLLGFLLQPPSYESVTYSYAGEHKEPEGTADMIDVKGKSGFATRLYVDQKTGRLLMLSYRGKQLSVATRALARSRNAAPAPAVETGASVEQKERARQARAAMLEQRRKEFEEALAKAPEVEYRWVFSDYKNVKGYMLPHRVVKSEAGHDFEEWTISAFKINPKLNAALFETK